MASLVCLPFSVAGLSAQKVLVSEVATLDAFEGDVLRSVDHFPSLERRVLASSEKASAKIIEVFATDRQYPNIRIERTFSESGEPIEHAMVADQLIIETWSTYSIAEMDALLGKTGATVIEDLVAGRCFLIQLSSTDINRFDAATDSLRRNKAIMRNVGPNSYGVILDTVVPDYDPLLANDDIFVDGVMWHLDNPDDHDIDAPEGWALQNDAPDTVIAVIDTGVDLDHPDLVGNLWDDGFGNHGRDIVDGDNSPDDVYYLGIGASESGHGSQVAGLIGGTGNNELGICGVVWDTQIMAIKVFDVSGSLNNEGSTFSSNVISGMEWSIQNGAGILNLSLSDNFASGYRTILDEALNQDVIVVKSAGNNGSNLSTVARGYPQRLADEYPNMIVVGASNRNDDIYQNFFTGDPISNFHPELVTVAAPGEYLHTTNKDGGYAQEFAATSGATPIVSGIAALVQDYFDCSAIETVQRIKNSVDLLETWRDKCEADGRVNLQRSLSIFSNVPTDKADFSDPGWRESPWFGWIWDCELGWYYHLEMGWLHTSSRHQDYIWFFHMDMGEWIYTNQTVFPTFYRLSDDVWLEYQEGTSQPQVFWNPNTQMNEYVYHQ